MRLAEFREQHDYQNLAEALISNTSLRYLDMAESIFDFVPDEETSMALKEILANNKTLEHLDISGECARLEASNMGPSINQALCGLFKNSTLKVLVIRNQKIDGEGAAVLAQVLKDNMTLREIHLERNVISLRGFFLLVQALHHNKTLTFLSDAEDMKGTALKRINSYARKAMPLAELNRQASIAGVRSRFFKSTTKKESTKEPVHTATSASMKFASRWKREQMQLRLYLERNKKIATSEDDPTNAAEPSPDDDDDSDLEYPTDNDPTPPPPNMDFENAVEALGPDLARDYAWIWAHMREHTYEVFR